ncbi:hypothetical protein SK128_017143 [Halocaridina rubra]|uniref:Uncharacterized protein n=1 Tax=Halocaridina rubra TaxID=373956 RepID=A0AAN8WL34_HALRR
MATVIVLDQLLPLPRLPCVRLEFKDMLVSKAELNMAPLKPMVCQPMRIHLKDDMVLFVIHTPRPIPFTFQIQVKEELDFMVQQDIIKTAGDEPSESCHPLVVAPQRIEAFVSQSTSHATTVNCQDQLAPLQHPSPPSAVSPRRHIILPQRMSFAGTGKWDSPSKITTSLLLSPHMDISNIADDP